MSIQTIFFLYVASKQFENVLKDKINFIKILSENNQYVYDYIQILKNNYVNGKDYTNVILQRQKYNNQILVIYCGIPMIVISSILIYILFFMKSQKKWKSVDTLSLFFVTLAYLTELFLFFCVISQYVFIGDQYLIYNFILKLF
jgi:hypothetical protein